MASAARSVTECMARAVAHVLRLLLLVVTYLLLVVVVLFKTLVRLPVTLYQGCASVLRGDSINLDQRITRTHDHGSPTEKC